MKSHYNFDTGGRGIARVLQLGSKPQLMVVLYPTVNTVNSFTLVAMIVSTRMRRVPHAPHWLDKSIVGRSTTFSSSGYDKVNHRNNIVLQKLV